MTLFDQDVKTIGKHITNVFSEGELSKEATVAKYTTVQKEGDREVTENEKRRNFQGFKKKGIGNSFYSSFLKLFFNNFPLEVNLYFCNLLLGLSGMVISTNSCFNAG